MKLRTQQTGLICTNKACRLLGVNNVYYDFESRMKTQGINPVEVVVHYWRKKDILLLRDDLLTARNERRTEIKYAEISKLHNSKLQGFVIGKNRITYRTLRDLYPKTYATRRLIRRRGHLRSCHVYDKEVFLTELDEQVYLRAYASHARKTWMPSPEVYEHLGLTGTHKTREVLKAIDRCGLKIRSKELPVLLKSKNNSHSLRNLVCFHRDDINKLKEHILKGELK